MRSTLKISRSLLKLNKGLMGEQSFPIFGPISSYHYVGGNRDTMVKVWIPTLSNRLLHAHTIPNINYPSTRVSHPIKRMGKNALPENGDRTDTENELLYESLSPLNGYIRAGETFSPHWKPENLGDNVRHVDIKRYLLDNLDRVTGSESPDLINQLHRLSRVLMGVILSTDPKAMSTDLNSSLGIPPLATYVRSCLRTIASHPAHADLDVVLELMYILGHGINRLDSNNTWDIKYFLERECIRRLPHFSPSQKLMAADVLYHSRAFGPSRYLENMVRVWMEDGRHQRGNYFTAHQFTQIMYYFSVARTIDPTLAKILLSEFKNIGPFLSIEQLAMACSGFFKTNNLIRDQNVLIDVTERLGEGIALLLTSHNEGKIAPASAVLFNMLVKTVRSGLVLKDSSRLVCQTFVESFATSFNTKSPSHRIDVPMSVLSQVAWLTTNMLLVDHRLTGLILESLTNHRLHKGRFKDITKLVWCLTSLNPPLHTTHPDPVSRDRDLEVYFKNELGDIISRELDKPARYIELSTYVDQFSVVLYGLSLYGYYPENLLTKFHALVSRVRPERASKSSSGFDGPVTRYTLQSVSKTILDLDDVCLALYASLKIERPDLFNRLHHPHYSSVIQKHYRDLGESYSNAHGRNDVNVATSLRSYPLVERRSSRSSDKDSYKVLADEVCSHLPRALTTDPSGAELSVRYKLLKLFPHIPTHDIYLTLQPPGAPIYYDEGADVHKCLTSQRHHLVLLLAPYLAYNSAGSLNGKYLAKVRQLGTYGYRTALVPWYDWQKVSYDSLRATEYLSEIIRETMLSP